MFLSDELEVRDNFGAICVSVLVFLSAVLAYLTPAWMLLELNADIPIPVGGPVKLDILLGFSLMYPPVVLHASQDVEMDYDAFELGDMTLYHIAGGLASIALGAATINLYCICFTNRTEKKQKALRITSFLIPFCAILAVLLPPFSGLYQDLWAKCDDTTTACTTTEIVIPMEISEDSLTFTMYLTFAMYHFSYYMGCALIPLSMFSIYCVHRELRLERESSSSEGHLKGNKESKVNVVDVEKVTGLDAYPQLEKPKFKPEKTNTPYYLF